MRLVFSGDHEIALDIPIVVGRQPDRIGYRAVELDDPDFSASKNHALLDRRPGDTVEVTDLGSTNGTTVRFGRDEIPLRPHEPTVVTTPCVIRCGSCAIDVRMG